MKLKKPVIIRSIAYKINNKSIDSNSIVLNELDVIYHIRQKTKTITASIKHIPKTIILALPSYYEAIESQISLSFLDQLLANKLGDDPQQTIDDLFPFSLNNNPYGVGSVFLRLISKYGIKIDANCKCLAYLNQMNKNGHQWCKSHKAEILDRLQKESINQQITFDNNVATKLLLRACDISKKLIDKIS